MKASTVLAAIGLAFWAATLIFAVDLFSSIRSQNAPGYPSPAQFGYFICAPAGVLIAIASTWLLAWRRKRTAISLLSVALALLLPYWIGLMAGGV